MHGIKSYASIRVDSKNVIILGENYEGIPSIGFAPDIIIVPKKVYKKYSKEHFLFLYNKLETIKTKIIKI